MKITDLKELPVRVKINENFKLEDSLDPNMIIQINNYRVDSDDFGICYRVEVTLLGSDHEHNKSVAIRDWRDPHSDQYDADYFVANVQKRQSNGDYRDVIFVMNYEDVFDFIDSVGNNKEINAVVAELNRIVVNLENSNKNYKPLSAYGEGYSECEKDIIDGLKYRIKELEDGKN